MFEGGTTSHKMCEERVSALSAFGGSHILGYPELSGCTIGEGHIRGCGCWITMCETG